MSKGRSYCPPESHLHLLPSRRHMFFFLSIWEILSSSVKAFFLSLMLSCRVNPYLAFWFNRFIIRGHFCNIISAKIQFYGNEVKSELMCDISPFFHLTIQKKHKVCGSSGQISRLCQETFTMLDRSRDEEADGCTSHPCVNTTRFRSL